MQVRISLPTVLNDEQKVAKMQRIDFAELTSPFTVKIRNCTFEPKTIWDLQSSSTEFYHGHKKIRLVANQFTTITPAALKTGFHDKTIEATGKTMTTTVSGSVQVTVLVRKILLVEDEGVLLAPSSRNQ